jgi:hypothetical protein
MSCRKGWLTNPNSFGIQGLSRLPMDVEYVATIAAEASCPDEHARQYIHSLLHWLTSPRGRNGVALPSEVAEILLQYQSYMIFHFDRISASRPLTSVEMEHTRLSEASMLSLRRWSRTR